MATVQTWPSGLPAPQLDSHSLTLGSNTVWRELENGEREGRRFGTGAPHRLQCSLLLFGKDVATFQEWHRTQLNGGRNWFYASWLALFGLENHYARIQGYLVRESKGNLWSRFSLTLLIVPEAQAWADAFWQSAGTGGAEPGEDPVEGEVVVWGRQYSVAQLPPEGVRATKVLVNIAAKAGCPAYNELSGSTAGVFTVALHANKTITAWGPYVSQVLPGWESLGGIIDIAKSGTGLYYLTAAGSIGHLGTPQAGTAYPSVIGAKKIWAHTGCNALYGLGIVQLASGELLFWGGSTAMQYVPAGVYSPRCVATSHLGSNSQQPAIIVDHGGVPHLVGVPYGTYWPSITDAVHAYFHRYGSHTHCCVFLENGTWLDFVTNNSTILARMTQDRPTGLIPTQVAFAYNDTNSTLGLALHQDGTVVGWPNNFFTTYGNIPAGLKGTWVDVASGKKSSTTATTYYALAAVIKKD